MLTDRLVTREEIRTIVREELRTGLDTRDARLRAEIQSSARQQLLAFVAIMTLLIGMLGGFLSLVLR